MNNQNDFIAKSAMNFAKNNQETIKKSSKAIGKVAYDNREKIAQVAYDNKEYIAQTAYDNREFIYDNREMLEGLGKGYMDA